MAEIEIKIPKKELEKTADKVLPFLAEVLTASIKEAQVKLRIPATWQMYENTIPIIDKSKKWFGVHVNVPYAGYVEFGTPPRAKFPPYSAIAEWVRTKLKIPDGRRKEFTNTVWAIMTKIKNEGTEPKPFMDRGINIFKKHLGRTKRIE